VGYVEREAFAAACLVARMEAQDLGQSPVWDDLATLRGDALSPLVGRVDLLCAGFSCQPWSSAGKQLGTADERWIWPEIDRVIRAVGPSLVVLENVPGLAVRGGLGHVLGDMAEAGFDAVWDVFSAAETGAPHRRERLFLLAWRVSDAQRDTLRDLAERGPGPAPAPNQRDALAGNVEQDLADAEGERSGEARKLHPRREDRSAWKRFVLADPDSGRLSRERIAQPGGIAGPPGREPDGRGAARGEFPPGPGGDWSGIPRDLWPALPQSEVCRAAHGVAAGVDVPVCEASRADRLRACGNGVVPATAELAFWSLLRRAFA